MSASKPSMTAEEMNTYSVLLVEDNPADAERMEYLLEADNSADFSIKTVLRIREAIIELKENNYDLILLDISLPDGIGVETVKMVREASLSVPIIVITGRDEEDLAKACIAAGAQDYVVKKQSNPSESIRSIGYSLLNEKNSDVGEFESIIDQYRKLSSIGSNTSVTAGLSGAGAVKERYNDVFEQIAVEYADLVKVYLDQLITHKQKPQNKMEKLVTRLGDAGGGPRDLLDVHLAALDRLIAGEDTSRSQSFAVEGRLLALEMMGLLVDYYRVGKRRRF